jgi:hypothetical protein
MNVALELHLVRACKGASLGQEGGQARPLRFLSCLWLCVAPCIQRGPGGPPLAVGLRRCPWVQESGAFPAKVVEREDPNLDKDLGEQRTCKWCGRLSSRVKDTEAGPLCGVCQLNTATATRLNKDPYSQTGTKVPKQVSAGGCQVACRQKDGLRQGGSTGICWWGSRATHNGLNWSPGCAAGCLKLSTF